uniref:RRM domain-containing protein n=1 Tax=Ascaris lumbricoides TaxID=6252 RepID=A0A0M3HGK9_ASCLU
MKGYVFIVFDDERSVRRLVNHCHRDGNDYYLLVSSPTMRNKPVRCGLFTISLLIAISYVMVTLNSNFRLLVVLFCFADRCKRWHPLKHARLKYTSPPSQKKMH